MSKIRALALIATFIPAIAVAQEAGEIKVGDVGILRVTKEVGSVARFGRGSKCIIVAGAETKALEINSKGILVQYSENAPKARGFWGEPAPNNCASSDAFYVHPEEFKKMKEAYRLKALTQPH